MTTVTVQETRNVVEVIAGTTVEVVESVQQVVVNETETTVQVVDQTTTVEVGNPSVVVVQQPVTSVVEVSSGGSNGSAALYAAGLPQGVNEGQQIKITGSPTGGSVDLDYGGQIFTVNWNASDIDMLAALEALSNIGAGNVEVQSDGNDFPTGTMLVIFKGTLADTNLAAITLDTNALTGGTSPTVTITTFFEGAAPVAGAPVTAIQFETTEVPYLQFNVGTAASPDWRTLGGVRGLDPNGHTRADFTASAEGTVQFTTSDDAGQQVAVMDVSQEDIRMEVSIDGDLVVFMRMDIDGFRFSHQHADGTLEGEIQQIPGGFSVETERNGAAIVQFLTGADDPSTGVGVPATAPALYIRETSGVTELWLKTGAADVDWTQVT